MPTALWIVLGCFGGLLLTVLAVYLFAPTKVTVSYKEKLEIKLQVAFCSFLIKGRDVTKNEVALIKKTFVTLKKHLTVQVDDFQIVVGSNDAAKTALLFAGISDTANILIDVIKSIDENAFDNVKNAGITADFASKKCAFSICFSAKTTICHALPFAIKNRKEIASVLEELKNTSSEFV